MKSKRRPSKSKKKLVLRKHLSTHRKKYLLAALVVVVFAAYLVGRSDAVQAPSRPAAAITPMPSATPEPIGGRLISVDASATYDIAQVESTIKWRFGAATPAVHYAVDYHLIRYTSEDENGNSITEYARVYIPEGVANPTLMSFAPGTTGVGDTCASSLEQPMVRNLGDYEAQYLAYASQGMAVVATDYEGMRDPNDLHHYMVGLLEGRAMLDAARAARRVTGLTQIARDPIFLGGYSQGGQAAFWADEIDHGYAPDVQLSGLVAMAPVSSVLQTWQGILHGSDIDWFGPYVLASYSDYYKNLDVDQVLLPKWTVNLLGDVTSHCIDSAPKFYGSNPAAVYTPEFLSALGSGDLAVAGYSALADDMAANDITQATSTPKLLLQNLGDTTILPAQTSAMNTQLCQMGSGHVQLTTFAGGTHYTMPTSGFATALQWMTNIKAGKTPPTDCPK